MGSTHFVQVNNKTFRLRVDRSFVSGDLDYSPVDVTHAGITSQALPLTSDTHDLYTLVHDEGVQDAMASVWWNVFKEELARPFGISWQETHSILSYTDDNRPDLIIASGCEYRTGDRVIWTDGKEATVVGYTSLNRKVVALKGDDGLQWSASETELRRAGNVY